MRYSTQQRDEIANFIKINPKMTVKEYMKTFNCGRTIITDIRIKYKLGARKIKTLTKIQREEIYHYVKNNPKLQCDEVADIFSCTSGQVSKIRVDFKLAVQRDNKEEIFRKTKEVITYLEENPMAKFKNLSEKFSLSDKRLRVILKQYKLSDNYKNLEIPEKVKNNKVWRIIDGIKTSVSPLYDYYQAESSYIRINSKSRSHNSISLLVKNSSYLPPEQEELIVTHMINNPNDDYAILTEKFQCSQKIIEKIRSRNNFKTIKKQFVKSFQNLLALEGKRKCPSCDKIKNISEWYLNTPGYCKECSKKQGPAKLKRQQEKHVASLERFLKKKLSDSRQRKNIPGEHTLTHQDLMDQYNEQNGLCAYSGRPLAIALRSVSENSLSIDRVDSTKNYTRDNIVLCCSIINLMKLNHSVETFIKACLDVTTYNDSTKLLRGDLIDSLI